MFLAIYYDVWNFELNETALQMQIYGGGECKYGRMVPELFMVTTCMLKLLYDSERPQGSR